MFLIITIFLKHQSTKLGCIFHIFLNKGEKTPNLIEIRCILDPIF